MNVLPLRLFPLLFERLRMHSSHATSVTSLVISLVTRIRSLSYLPSSVLMMCSSSSVSSCTEKQNKPMLWRAGDANGSRMSEKIPVLKFFATTGQVGGWRWSHTHRYVYTDTCLARPAQFFICSNLDLVFRTDVSSKQKQPECSRPDIIYSWLCKDFQWWDL